MKYTSETHKGHPFKYKKIFEIGFHNKWPNFGILGKDIANTLCKGMAWLSF